VARFERSSVATFDDYLVTFYPREDVGHRGSGFVLFLNGESAGLGEFVSLKIDFRDTAAEIIPTPRPLQMTEHELRSHVQSLLHRMIADPTATSIGALVSRRRYRMRSE
jgi:hypothetical protein